MELQLNPRSMVVDTVAHVLDWNDGTGELSLREAIGWANALSPHPTITFDTGPGGVFAT